ncbi:MAG: dihydrodipicolinate synthase family protein, partial [Oscillospiraceae bacterium]|nr:dihydrodipicolinate synthase family protein [Oscillospiraceae bacterium]
PQEMHQICAEYMSGNTDKSRDMMIHYLDLMDGLFCDVNPIPVKEAMNMMGYQCGPCRLPLAPMSEKAKAELAALLKKHGLL